MKKIFVVLISFAAFSTAFAQKTTPKKTIDLSSQSGDHLMMQFSSDSWMGAPDSISSHKKGLSRGLSVYLMMNKPFKNNPKFSAAFGIGIGTSHLFYEKLSMNIAGTSSTLIFSSLDTLSRFKKYKVSTAYAEIPVEIRYATHPENPNKSFKAAIGVKVGTLLNAHTKGKTLQDATGKTINSYTEKTSAKSYFNSTRIAATARIGYGALSLFGSYTLSSVFKDNVASKMNLMQIGFTLSGL